MPGTVRVSRAGDVVVATLTGEIDVSNIGRISDQLYAAVPNDARGLAVDLADCRYVDSAGVRLFFELVRRLRDSRQALALAVPAESPIHRLFTVTKLDEAATLCGSAGEAIIALSGDHPAS